MSRPQYKITKKDYFHASRYLIGAMERGDVSKAMGYDMFRKATDAQLLQTWCDDYLPDETFEKMKRAIRASRKRSIDYRHKKSKVGIDLSKVAHLDLSTLADELNLTLSDTVLLLVETYWKSKQAGIS